MGGRHRQPEHVGRTNGTHCHHFGRSPLGIAEVGLADLLAYRHHDAPPADHGAQPQCDGHGHFHPQRDVAGGIIQLGLEQQHLAACTCIECHQLVLLDQADGFAGQVHVVAHVGHGFGRYSFERAITFDLFADHAGQRRQRRYQLRVGPGLGNERGQHLAWVGRCRLWGAAHQCLAGYLGDRGKLQGLFIGHGLVQCVSHRQGANQDQHDQAHAFLAVVGAVGKGHPGAGQDQYTANPPWWWCLAFRRLVQRLALDQRAQGQQQQGGTGKAEQWREQQGITDLAGLGPVHTTGAVAPMHQGIGHAHADDRTDQGVRG